jgi:glycosyltransferase involved in cell wall biosynthesis
MTKISVVTISYNQAKYIEECIRSVIEQNYQNYEYIIVDPGSTDGSREIIKKYNDFFAHIIFEADEGPADGLNKGFSYASGDIYYFLNSDDVVCENTFSTVANFFERNPSIDLIYGNGLKIDEKGDVFKYLISDRFSLEGYAQETVTFVQQSMFFRANAYKIVGGFNKFNKITWDAELLVDFALHNMKIRKLNNYFGKFRWYSSSISGSGLFRENYIKDRLRLFKKIKGREKRNWDIIVRYALFVWKYINNPYKIYFQLINSKINR